MRDSVKTKAQLIAELDELRQRVAELETVETEHRRAEEVLAEERNLLRTLIDNLPDYIFFKDAESRFIINNAAHLRVLGATRQEEVVGKTDFDYFPRELAEQYYADEQEVIRSGDTLMNREETTVDPDGRRQWLLTSKVPLRDSRRKIVGLVGVSRDITDRKQAEEALARSNAELERFAYMISYDMQEPLHAIAEDLQFLEHRLGEQLDAKSRRTVTDAVAAAERIQTLSNELLVYSRIGTWGTLLEPIDGQEVLDHALENLQPAVQESGAVVTHDPLPTLVADASQLLPLFQHLIANAITYRSEAPPQIHVGVERQEGGWLFSVRDNGIGIDPRYVDQIFVIFQRLHEREEHPGIGVGLAICKKVVESHGGRIWVESKPGAGSTFYFTVPDPASESPEPGSL